MKVLISSYIRVIYLRAALFGVMLQCVTQGFCLELPRAGQSITSGPAQVFRIGYLRGDPEAMISGRVVEELRDSLLASPKVKAAMKTEGLDDIIVQAADSHQGLRDWWMSQNQVDMVFCSAIDLVWQTGNYEPVFQYRGDFFDPGGNRKFHRGAIFTNNRSELFNDNRPAAQLAPLITQNEIAMVGSYSAAGYVYPCLKLASLTSNTLPQKLVFCESSEEVVKYVINGVTEFGACDRAVIDKVLKQHGLEEQKDSLVRVLVETDLIPTDPVALQAKWLPRTSVFGRELKRAMREFFRQPEYGKVILEDTSADAYTEIRENLEKFQSLTSSSRN